MFAVIYDRLDEEGKEHEEYYGFFDTPEKALRLYRDMIRGHEAEYTNARIMTEVRAIQPEELQQRA